MISMRVAIHIWHGLTKKGVRTREILTEIGAVRFAVDAFTNPAVVTVSPVALAAVAAAFGLATNTVNNFNSLLLQLDHTTVQSVVFVNRRIFREKLPQIADRQQADGHSCVAIQFDDLHADDDFYQHQFDRYGISASRSQRDRPGATGIHEYHRQALPRPRPLRSTARQT